MNYIQTVNTFNLLYFYVEYIDLLKYRDTKYTHKYLVNDAEINQ